MYTYILLLTNKCIINKRTKDIYLSCKIICWPSVPSFTLLFYVESDFLSLVDSDISILYITIYRHTKQTLFHKKIFSSFFFFSSICLFEHYKGKERDSFDTYNTLLFHTSSVYKNILYMYSDDSLDFTWTHRHHLSLLLFNRVFFFSFH